MVAINQFDGLTVGTDAAPAADTPVAVKIDKTKLTNAAATDIVLKSGDSLGSTVAVQAIALQAAATGYTVTFKSGNVDVASIKTNDDGTVTLPTKATLSKSSNFYEYQLYSWVAVDGDGNQVGDDILISAGTYKPTADVTLYAKYKSTKPYGSITGNSRLSARDIDAFKKGILNKDDNYSKIVRYPIYEGGAIIGSITGNARLTARDIDAFKQGILSKNDAYRAKVQNPIYVIDK